MSAVMQPSLKDHVVYIQDYHESKETFWMGIFLIQCDHPSTQLDSWLHAFFKKERKKQNCV